MPLLGFTKLKRQLLNGSKTQTIRKPRKHPIRKGDKLFIYWKLRTKECEKLGEAIVTKIVRKALGAFTLKDIQKDGFESYAHFDVVFCHGMHPEATMQTKFDIITFKWTKKEEVEN